MKKSISNFVSAALGNRPVLWLVPALLLLVGLFGLGERLWFGKEATALTSYVPWGIWVAAYVLLVWLEVGSLIVFKVLYHTFEWKELKTIKIGVLSAGLGALLTALFVIGMDLGQMSRGWYPFIRPNFASPMAWMIWLHVVFLAMLIIELFAVWRNDTKLEGLLYRLSLPVGILLLATVGAVFGMSAARPFWNIAALPIQFLLAALVAGMGLLVIQIGLFRHSFAAGQAESLLERLRTPFLLLLLASAGVAAVSAIVMIGPGIPAQIESLKVVLFGPYWWSFWILHIFLGVLIPILLLFFSCTRRAVVFAGILVVVGFTGLTPNLIIPALATGPVEALAASYIDARLHLDYFPSRGEWLLLVFAAGMGLSIFMGVRNLLISNLFRIQGDAHEQI